MDAFTAISIASTRQQLSATKKSNFSMLELIILHFLAEQ